MPRNRRCSMQNVFYDNFRPTNCLKFPHQPFLKPSTIIKFLSLAFSQKQIKRQSVCFSLPTQIKRESMQSRQRNVSHKNELWLLDGSSYGTLRPKFSVHFKNAFSFTAFLFHFRMAHTFCAHSECPPSATIFHFGPTQPFGEIKTHKKSLYVTK